jgi:hypothetical protein
MGRTGVLQSAIDQGAVEDSLPAGRMLLLLQRSPAQEAALRDFIQATHTPRNPSYRQWLSWRSLAAFTGRRTRLP